MIKEKPIIRGEGRNFAAKEYLANLKRRLYGGAGDKPPKVISTDEYRAIARKASFKCPIGRDPSTCDGCNCPVYPGDIWRTHYDECVAARLARLLLDDIAAGRVVIKRNRGEGFEVRLP